MKIYNLNKTVILVALLSSNSFSYKFFCKKDSEIPAGDIFEEIDKQSSRGSAL